MRVGQQGIRRMDTDKKEVDFYILSDYYIQRSIRTIITNPKQGEEP
jgi:hypothetical protein